MNVFDYLLRLNEDCPSRIILECEDRCLTVRQLCERATALSSALRRVGAVRGAHVALLADASIQSIEIYLATSRIGAVFTPIKSNQDDATIFHTLEEVRPAVLFYSKAFSALAEQFRKQRHITLVPLGGYHEFKRSRYENFLASGVQVPDVAEMNDKDKSSIFYEFKQGQLYQLDVLYGSFFQEFVQRRTLYENDRLGYGGLLACGSPHHALFMSEIIYALFCGRKITIMGKFHPRKWFEYLEKNQIDRTNLSTPMLNGILNDPYAAKADMSRLRIQLGYTPVTLEMLKKAVMVLPDTVQFVREYYAPYVAARLIEPLESSLYLDDNVNKAASKLLRLNSVGRVVPGCEIRIVKQDGEILEPGGIGEILVHREGMEEGWRRTGDIGWMDGNRYLYLLGQSSGSESVDWMRSYMVEEMPHDFVSGKEGAAINEQLLLFFKSINQSLEPDVLIANYLRGIRNLVPAVAYGIDFFSINMNGRPHGRSAEEYMEGIMPALEYMPTLGPMWIYDEWDKRWVTCSKDNYIGERYHYKYCAVFSPTKEMVGLLRFVRLRENVFAKTESACIRVISNHMSYIMHNASQYQDLRWQYRVLVETLSMLDMPVAVSDGNWQNLFVNEKAKALMMRMQSNKQFAKGVLNEYYENQGSLKYTNQDTQAWSRLMQDTDGNVRLASYKAYKLPADNRIMATVINIEKDETDLSRFDGLLSEREIDVLKLVAEGKLNKEISERLHISISTVKYHLRNIFEKLHVMTRVELIHKIMNT